MKATNEQAFLKAGFLGFQGSGKTYTAVMLALAIEKMLGDGRPVGFFDTETGSDFLIPRFEAEGVPLVRVKSRAFSDLLVVGREAEQTCAVLIIDSITHVWRELCDAYQKKRNIRRMEFQHWADIKREWGTWTDLYLNARLHIIICGRAGFEYDRELDDEGKKQLVKVGTKMKVENEFGFEPSLLIEMERVARDESPNFDPKDGKAKRRIGGAWVHRAHVLKDRTDSINGKHFDFDKLHATYKVGDYRQVFTPFEPVIKALNIGGAHLGVDTTRTSESMFDAGGSGPNGTRYTKVKVALETIESTLTLLWPGSDATSKKLKLHVIDAIYGQRSWTAVEKLPLEVLENGLDTFRRVETALNAGAIVDSPESLRSLVARVQVEAAELAAEEAAIDAKAAADAVM